MKSILVRKVVLPLASIPAAFFLERLLAALPGPRIPAPLTLVAAVVWLPVLPFFPRLFLAGAAGFIIDTFGEAPFGVFLLAFFCITLAAEVFRSLVSVRNWSIGHISVSSVLAVSSLLLVPLLEVLIAHIRI